LCSIWVAPTKSAAKIASDFNKPDGLTIIYPDKLVNFFNDLEVERISGIGVKTQQILKEEMGIQTIIS
jgi:DNA polymerase IV (archaeal DinB-like DNA polymerase)